MSPAERRSDTSRNRRAGLLWGLLSPELRRRVDADLNGAEIEQLNRALRSYLKAGRAERLLTERELLARLRTRQSTWPAFLSFALGVLFFGLIVLHFVQRPGLPLWIRAELFTPLFVAALAPLSLYLLAPYRSRELFRPTFNWEKTAAAGLASLGLLWILFEIRVDGGIAFLFRPDSLSWTILFLGGLIGPVAEEVVFRELLPSLFGGAPHYAGHFASALLFAAAHVPDSPTMFFLHVLAALILSGLRLNTDGLFWPTVVHATANGGVLLLGI